MASTALTFFALTAPGVASAAEASEEAMFFGVEDFGSSPQCFETGDDLNWCNDQANAFDDIFDGWQTLGYWGYSHDYINAGTDPADFADSALESWGDDAVNIYGVDDGDVGYISTHGNHSCSDGYYWSSFWVGESHSGQDCAIHTDVTAGDSDRDALYGNSSNSGDLEILFVDACEGAQYCVWDNGGYSAVDGDEFIMWGGFHGTSYDSSAQVDALEDYASVSRLNGVGDNWLDYRFAERGLLPDQCPTVIVWGSSAANRDSMFNSGGLDDHIDTGTHSGTSYYYICGCDPADGEQLPAC